jgi:WS/DGAT/MGAT family acyltransferase
LAALAGAFRRLLQDRGEAVEGLELRTTVPVNLKPLDQRDASLGNYFGLAFVPIPVGTADLNERIRIIHERMDAQKAGIEALLMYLTLSVGGHSPDPVLDWLMEQFENRATGVVTNVPGPLDTVEFAGKEVSDVMFWVPQANDQGIGISIFSYDGGVRVGIAADENLLPEPSELGAAFEREIESLAADIE